MMNKIMRFLITLVALPVLVVIIFCDAVSWAMYNDDMRMLKKVIDNLTFGLLSED